MSDGSVKIEHRGHSLIDYAANSCNDFSKTVTFGFWGSPPLSVTVLTASRQGAACIAASASCLRENDGPQKEAVTVAAPFLPISGVFQYCRGK